MTDSEPVLLPTPTASAYGRNCTSGRSNPDSAHHDGTTLSDAVLMLAGTHKRLKPRGDADVNGINTSTSTPMGGRIDMTAVSIAVLALFTISVTGLGLMLVLGTAHPDERAGDEDDDSDEVWLAELRALNAALPRVRKHRARAVARAGRGSRDSH